MTTGPAEVLAALKWRYATKKFDATRKIPADVWSSLEQSLVLSPSSYGLQPWKFVVVETPAVRAELRKASWNQSQITDASHMVVLCRKLEVTPADVESYVDRIVEVRGVPRAVLDDYRKMMLGSIANPAAVPGGSMEIWTRSQVYIALGVFLAACAVAHVDACPMEGFDPAAYDAKLGLREQGYTACVVATVGYRAADDAFAGMAKVRAEVAKVISRV